MSAREADCRLIQHSTFNIQHSTFVPYRGLDHHDGGDDMPLIVVGVNHRTASVDVRERLSIVPSRMAETLDDLRALDGINGAAILSTCNRVEAIVSAAAEDVIEPIVAWLTQRAGTARAELEKHVYILRHGDVLKHLFRVASGLDSMIVGEPQIAGQVRAAFLASRERGALGALLSQVLA